MTPKRKRQLARGTRSPTSSSPTTTKTAVAMAPHGPAFWSSRSAAPPRKEVAQRCHGEPTLRLAGHAEHPVVPRRARAGNP